MLRLGWGHGDDEIISRDQAIEWFDLDHVGKSPSRFDFKKLENLNGHYIREADDAAWPTRRVRLGLDAVGKDLLVPRCRTEGPRAYPLQLADGASFLFAERPLAMAEPAAELLTDEARPSLAVPMLRLRNFRIGNMTPSMLQCEKSPTRAV